MEDSSWIELGYAARAHGLQGELRLRLHNEASELLETLELLYVQAPGQSGHRTMRLEALRGTSQQPIVALEGCHTREQAEALVGAKLWVRREQLPALEDGEFYQADLIGLTVMDEQGKPLGTLQEVYSLPSNDVYVVRGPEIGELLVPAAVPWIGPIDLRARTLTLLNADALLEAARE